MRSPLLRRAEALQGVGVGQITRVVRVPTGFAIVKVVADTDGSEAVSAGPTATPAVAATGDVKYVFSVSGLGEADASVRDFSKPPDWNLDPRTILRDAHEGGRCS